MMLYVGASGYSSNINTHKHNYSIYNLYPNGILSFYFLKHCKAVLRLAIEPPRIGAAAYDFRTVKISFQKTLIDAKRQKVEIIIIKVNANFSDGCSNCSCTGASHPYTCRNTNNSTRHLQYLTSRPSPNNKSHSQ